MAAYNSARAERYQALTNTQLLKIAAGQTLSSAAARAELLRRDLAPVRTSKGWFLAPATPWQPPPKNSS